nr:ribonuclease III domain-containing protein [Myxacorys almedinensis]
MSPLSDGIALPYEGDVTSAQVQRLAPAALAYLGDAVYELYVRRHFLLPPKRSDTYHRQVVAQVRAEQQAEHLRSLLPLLSESEQGILKRGRNAASNRPKRLDPEIYQQATSLEALMGYLYLTNPTRLLELLNALKLDEEIKG